MVFIIKKTLKCKAFKVWNSRIKFWSGRRDSNPRPPPWQGDVLPLNYFRKMSHEGLEPSTLWLKVRCSTDWANGSNGWASRIRTYEWRSQSPLPYRLAIAQKEKKGQYLVHYSKLIKIMVEGGRFELPNPKERIYSPPRLATSLPLRY
jgi:hypothetical protein